jgi:hypothetical protein
MSVFGEIVSSLHRQKVSFFDNILWRCFVVGKLLIAVEANSGKLFSSLRKVLELNYDR